MFFFLVYQVKVRKGEETVTAVFNEEITAWAQNSYRGKSDQLT